jgi:hypothetical protein
MNRRWLDWAVLPVGVVLAIACAVLGMALLGVVRL